MGTWTFEPGHTAAGAIEYYRSIGALPEQRA
jgi:hypothetical protein